MPSQGVVRIRAKAMSKPYHIVDITKLTVHGISYHWRNLR